MKTNKSKTHSLRTHEGAPAKHIDPLAQLKRSVMACLLWEKTFYEEGESVVDRIRNLVLQCSPEAVATLAIEARLKFKLRHAPLLLICALFDHHIKYIKMKDLINTVINRPDEITELISLYRQNHDRRLPRQMKLGLALAFHKFDEYQLAKYNRKRDISLKTAMILCHPKPSNPEQEAMWKRLLEGKLKAPDTWESARASGKDAGETFRDLISRNKLGDMALLMNLRNMKEAGLPKSLIASALKRVTERSKLLPFRFISAMKVVPGYEDILDEAMLRTMGNMEKLPGKTIVVVDCSGSMKHGRLSDKSHTTYFDAAAALAILAREISGDCQIFAYGSVTEEVPARRGMALRDALNAANVGWETNLGYCMKRVNNEEYDRAIVITDEQSRDSVPDPKGLAYVINVNTYKNGIGYGKYVHIDGFSQATIDFIREYERE